MAPIDRKRLVERRMLRLLKDSGLPSPDQVEYGEECVRFLWLDLKVAVVVDLEGFGERDALQGYDYEDVAV